jgi:hypothetical protein
LLLIGVLAACSNGTGPNSATSNWVYFASDTESATYPYLTGSIRRIHLDGTGLTILHECGGPCGGLLYASGGQLLVYPNLILDHPSFWHTTSLDGKVVSSGNTVPLEDVTEFRRDGAVLLGVAVAGAHSAVATSRTDGTGLVLLTDGSARDSLPAYSPDASRILFLRQFSGTSGSLLTMSANGSRITDLLPDSLSRTSIVLSAGWSPDGTHIAFSRRQDPDSSRNGSFVIGVDGRGLRRVSKTACFTIRWSPDGRRALCKAEDGYIVAMSSTSFATDTLSPDSENADFFLAPDGRTLVVNRGDASIWLIEPGSLALHGLVVTHSAVIFTPIVIGPDQFHF